MPLKSATHTPNLCMTNLIDIYLIKEKAAAKYSNSGTEVYKGREPPPTQQILTMLRQQHHLHLPVIMRSQGSSPMLRSVHKQTAGCSRPANALQHLAPPGSESGRTRFLCQQDFSRTHTHIPERVPPKTRRE